MATIFSNALNNMNLGHKVMANEHRGKMQTLHWNFPSLPAGNIGDVLVCAIIYKNDRILSGREAHSALSSAGGTATGSYGTYTIAPDGFTLSAVDDVDRFLVATDMDAAGSNALADSIAHYIGYEATANFFLCLTNSVEAFATAGRVTGYLQILRD